MQGIENEYLNCARDRKWDGEPSEGMDIWQQATPPLLGQLVSASVRCQKG